MLFSVSIIFEFIMIKSHVFPFLIIIWFSPCLFFLTTVFFILIFHLPMMWLHIFFLVICLEFTVSSLLLFCHIKYFYFSVVKFINLFFYGFWIFNHSQKGLLYSRIIRNSSMLFFYFSSTFRVSFLNIYIFESFGTYLMWHVTYKFNFYVFLTTQLSQPFYYLFILST